MNWSKESYRLDKVTDKFDLPRIVRLNEGFFPRDGSGILVKGDIISLNKEMLYDKVSAHFIHWNQEDCGCLTSDRQEIFVPHNYNGKLNVLKKITTVHSVRELAKIFPSHAELTEKLTIKAYNEDKAVKLDKGTIIELERVIPGSINGFEKEPDELVIHFKHSKKNKVAAIPFTTKGKFLTKADFKSYSVRKAIERYGLPLDVKFLNNEIRHTFYKEVLTGHRKPGSVTGTARLNRIVMQRIIVGHYISDKEDVSGRDVREGIVVIPIENEEIGKIPVNVCEGHECTKYKYLNEICASEVFEHTVKESLSLCLDFTVRPEIKRLPVADRKHQEPPIHEESENTEEGYLIPVTKRRAQRTVPRPEESQYITVLEGYVDMTGARSYNAAVGNPPVPPRRPILHNNNNANTWYR